MSSIRKRPERLGSGNRLRAAAGAEAVVAAGAAEVAPEAAAAEAAEAAAEAAAAVGRGEFAASARLAHLPIPLTDADRHGWALAR